jgi:mono/diheme cytochrome c family protein
MACRLLPRVWIVFSVLVLSTAEGPAEENRAARTPVESFEKLVRPVLSANCFTCHGPEKQKGGLRLDSRAAMLTGGDSGPAIVPGHAEQSLLIKAIHYADEPRMPPKGRLSAEAIAALTAWIQQGAPWPSTDTQLRTLPGSREFKLTAEDRAFWSFQPIADPAPPTVVLGGSGDIAWPKTPVDQFVLAKLETNGLKPAESAGKRTLIRRATFDLIGLPPTPEEIDAFLRDDSADAFAKVVDRLLASPHYGERWARHWLDVARYGEDQAHTFQARKYPNGYRYRDWLIRAFNEDMPYDRFIKEQIAGDLLGEPGLRERLPALGFFALGPVYYGDPKKLDQLDDRIDTLTRGFLGLTVACARCHDHKFDPIPTKDYYALAGVFASTEYDEFPLVPPAVVEEAKRKQTDADKKKNLSPSYPFVHALKDGPRPVNMRVHIRGNPETLGDEVPRRFLCILGGESKPFTKGSGRLELAEDIANPNNPLTARVMVNRVWQHHFGKGLVRTPSNFGARGERPTHAELLDYLAQRFVQSGWSMKALHRLIMLSATYQQSSRFDPRNHDRDPDNQLLWRMNRRRLEVEAWRDGMLAVANNLRPTIGGPSMELTSPDNCRRTLYAFVSRHELNSLLRLFDFPDANITNDQRTVTTVPLQQLFVLNSEFMVRNAKALAARLAARPAEDNAVRIRRAFLLLYGRPVTDRELQLGLAFLAADPVEENGDGGNALTPWEQYAQVLLSASEFLYVD